MYKMLFKDVAWKVKLGQSYAIWNLEYVRRQLKQIFPNHCMLFWHLLQ